MNKCFHESILSVYCLTQALPTRQIISAFQHFMKVEEPWLSSRYYSKRVASPSQRLLEQLPQRLRELAWILYWQISTHNNRPRTSGLSLAMRRHCNLESILRFTIVLIS
ncbi:hypothetical protein CFBP6109_P300019 (plasmid) [Pseudomonas syringae pv. cerasicola]|nr:hypothetical protein CFBP6109_P300019 [Pseudomonas syringae pv. cerasicola]